MDAVLSAPERRTLVRLSLCPPFRRGWSSTCDALADGSLDVNAVRALFQASVPVPAPGERPLWVVDGTHWPRPAAATSAARTWEYRPLPGKTSARRGPRLGQDLASWLGAHVRALEFYGGAPRLIVPDNLKSGVTKSCWYEPGLNASYLELSAYHQQALLEA